MTETKLKTRELLTNRQRSILITFYNRNPYPSSSERHQLVQLTNRTPKQIQDWFANRRRNDPKLIPGKPVSVSSPSPPPPPPPPSTIDTNYCYYEPPPPTTICQNCGLPQLYPNYYSYFQS